MKKMIWIGGLAALVLALGVAGVSSAFAQDTAPPYEGRGPKSHGESGVMRTFMVTEFAKKLNLNVNDVNTRLDAGETLREIALSENVTPEELPTLMQEVRENALDAAVKANVITQEQADRMKSHGSGGGMHGSDGNNCDQSGPHGNRGGPGRQGRGQGNQQPSKP